MTTVVLRLAGPLQSWSGYRLALNKDSVSPTEALPRKSAVNGLIGAALGTRDLEAIGTRYGLHVRVEKTNPATEDYQTLGPLPGFVPRAVRGRATDFADRSERLATAGRVKEVKSKRDGGNVVKGSYTSISRKDYLAHSEFMVALETRDDETARRWLAALREPVFMPYLGRKSCPPSFPFILGLWRGDVAHLWRSLPHVGDAIGVLRAYLVAGDYDAHSPSDPSIIEAPVVTDRADQLAWAKEHLA